MSVDHVEALLIPYLRGELAPAERQALEAHLAGCRTCAHRREEFARLIADLAQVMPSPPAVHWGAYRAELRQKLDRRVAPVGGRRVWFLRPVPAALATGLVAVLLYVGGPGLPKRMASNGEPAALENVLLASRLDLIASMGFVERLEMLEDFDVIRGLDNLSPRREG